MPDKVTYLDLLYASMLPSGADATDTLAISLTGSINNFVKLIKRTVIYTNNLWIWWGGRIVIEIALEAGNVVFFKEEFTLYLSISIYHENCNNSPKVGNRWQWMHFKFWTVY